jgi:F0F1-type ATP synthase assembly protein I
VNNDTPFQEPSVPILIWWPRVVVDLVEHGGGAYFVPAAQAISFAVTFANTSAIDQSVGTTFTLVQLQPEAGQ